MGYHFRDLPDFVRILELTPALRRQIETTVDHLIGILDACDGDVDLEDGGDDEPSLGWIGMRGEPFENLCDDREAENEHHEDGGDNEPTLGALERHPDPWSSRLSGDQTHWGGRDTRARLDECEDENEHGGDILDEAHDGDGDDEPWIGWAEGRMDQTKPYSHCDDCMTDREADEAEDETQLNPPVQP